MHLLLDLQKNFFLFSVPCRKNNKKQKTNKQKKQQKTVMLYLISLN